MICRQSKLIFTCLLVTIACVTTFASCKSKTAEEYTLTTANLSLASNVIADIFDTTKIKPLPFNLQTCRQIYMEQLLDGKQTVRSWDADNICPSKTDELQRPLPPMERTSHRKIVISTKDTASAQVVNNLAKTVSNDKPSVNTDKKNSRGQLKKNLIVLVLTIMLVCIVYHGKKIARIN